MYAVIKTGGKQYKVAAGDTLKIEKLALDIGQTIEFEEILLVADGGNVKLGVPFIAGGKVVAEIVSHGRGKKINIIKFRRRKHSMKRQGHRQDFTEIKINAIQAA